LALQRVFRSVADDNTAIAGAAERHVLGDERHRPAVIVDEHCARRAAAERLEPDRAGPGEQIEDARIHHARHDDIEERFAQLV
jgi:hypothetical protein